MIRVIFFDRGRLDAGKRPVAPFCEPSGLPGFAGCGIDKGPLFFDHCENQRFVLKRPPPLPQNRLCATVLGQGVDFHPELSRLGA